jgi:Peptidase MA superfamily
MTACAVLLAATAGYADTIHLKNGASVVVDKAVERDGQVEYWVGSTKYVIPSGDVEKIEKSAGPTIRVGGQVPLSIVPNSNERAPGLSVDVTAPASAGSASGGISVTAPSTESMSSEEAEERHFHLRYEGPQAPLALERDVLDTMEEQYDKLSRDLRYTPTQSLAVMVYTEREFFDVTRAPSWTRGLRHDQLSIPLRGISTMTPALQHVLRDEISYWFAGAASKQRCPAWLNEGLAQMMEPRGPSPYDAFLAHLFAQHEQISFSRLEQSFDGLPPTQAGVAYAQSQATVEYLRDRYGMADVLRILQRIGAGDTAETALRTIIHTDYAGLNQEVGAYLAKKPRR